VLRLPSDAHAPLPAFPPALRRLARLLTGTAPGSADAEYRLWLALTTPSARELQEQRRRAERARASAWFDVVVLRRAGDALDVARTERSIARQTWQRWRVHDLEAGADPTRILDEARGDWAVLLEAGDELAPHALASLALAAGDGIELLYMDEDQLSPTGRERPVFKARWSPEQLASEPYLGRAFAARRSRIARALDGAAPAPGTMHGFQLRLAASVAGVTHVPDVLLHRRAGAPVDAATPVVESAPAGARVAVVIPTRDQADLLAACIASLDAHANRAEIELVVVDNGSTTEDARAVLRGVAARPYATVLPWHRPFNWSAVNNAAVRATTAEHLLFLNNDVEARHAGWLDRMVALTRRPGVASVGAQLLYPDGALQHYGVVVGMTGFAGHLLQGCRPDAPTRCGPTDVDRNCSSVTGACMLVRREVFERLGGFDESFVLCGSDVALGLAALGAGMRSVVTAGARLVHHEARTRGSSIPRSDFRRSFEVYDPWLRRGDAYYNPNLSLRDSTACLRLAPEDMRAVARRIARRA
jgi:GT2 family glycosyltransferase